jgi:hypothetical protein
MMFKAFHAMGLSPQGSTAEELDKWITNYNIKKEQKPQISYGVSILLSPPEKTLTFGGYEDIAVACWCLILGLTASSSVVVGKVSE